MAPRESSIQQVVWFSDLNRSSGQPAPASQDCPVHTSSCPPWVKNHTVTFFNDFLCLGCSDPNKKAYTAGVGLTKKFHKCISSGDMKSPWRQQWWTWLFFSEKMKRKWIGTNVEMDLPLKEKFPTLKEEKNAGKCQVGLRKSAEEKTVVYAENIVLKEACC